MKKSLFNLAMFVFIAFLTILVPAYILLSGSATLVPLAKAGALFALMPIVGFTATCILLHAARPASTHRLKSEAHATLLRTYARLDSMKTWRKVFSVLRLPLCAILLLAIGLPVYAALYVIALVGVLCSWGLLNRFNQKNGPFAVEDGKVFINGAYVSEKRASKEHDRTMGWMGKVNEARSNK